MYISYHVDEIKLWQHETKMSKNKRNNTVTQESEAAILSKQHAPSHTHTHICIYVYICGEREREAKNQSIETNSIYLQEKNKMENEV